MYSCLRDTSPRTSSSKLFVAVFPVLDAAVRARHASRFFPSACSHSHRDIRPFDPLTDSQWALVRNSQTTLQETSMETCIRCDERWFNLKCGKKGSFRGVCRKCRTKDKQEDRKENPSERTYFYSQRNNMRSDDVPSHLPVLTQVEEMLISRVHTIIEVRQVRGQKYFYRGHVAYFLVDIPRVYDRLPLLPCELELGGGFFPPRRRCVRLERCHWGRQFYAYSLDTLAI
ncbi:uncharacterized protein N7515_005029 [Penicillium bovifimosum]|uniref:DUF6570 domain-containing protein n=1 Tax=Penicillium bovifimosum TaxID=126998 RepID=A0A9W9L421_9EURO|nr:uncharacterized protein N7515_005029 [Penicillium bovifimosum]KAJ5135751.1 hypothetical protein N7515_005029 [Penicillium bovifimosum]